jgi:hypothetical protein
MIGVFAITNLVWIVIFVCPQAKPQIPISDSQVSVLAARSPFVTDLGNTVTDPATLARSVPGFLSLKEIEVSVAKTEQNSTCRVAVKTPAVMTDREHSANCPRPRRKYEGS